MQKTRDEIETEASQIQVDDVLDSSVAWDHFDISIIDQLLISVPQLPAPSSEVEPSNTLSVIGSPSQFNSASKSLLLVDAPSIMAFTASSSGSIAPFVTPSSLTPKPVQHASRRLVPSLHLLTFQDPKNFSSSPGK
jgi:hypothetical protein